MTKFKTQREKGVVLALKHFDFNCHLDFGIWNLANGIATHFPPVIARLAKCSGGVYLRLAPGGDKPRPYGRTGKMKKVRLNSKVRRAFQGSSRGFSLIEVAIAIALIGVIAVAVLGALSYASTVLIIADRRATAESLARSQLEYVKNQGYEEALYGGVATYEEIPGTSIPDGYTIWSFNRDEEIVGDVVGIPWNSGNSTAAYEDSGLQKITVIVSYDILRPDIRPGYRVVEEQFILEGYKRQPADYTEV